MSLLWVLPAGLASVGALVTGTLARRATEEAAALQGDLARLGELRAALVEVRDVSAGTAARRLRRLG